MTNAVNTEKDSKLITESQEQQRLVLKLRWLYPSLVFFAIPNGGKRNRGEAKTLVLEGVQAGVPDLFIAKSCHGFNGLFIELKVKDKIKGKVSKKQTDMIKSLKAQGYECHVCYGEKDAIEKIKAYLLG